VTSLWQRQTKVNSGTFFMSADQSSFNHPSFGRMTAERVIIFDTTLRDGEQSPGFSMNLAEKLRMAEALATLGVDVIEAGFPVASKGDFESVNEIARHTRGAVICALARSGGAKDIAAAGEALAPAERKRIHNFISTSPLHMKYKLRMEPETVLDLITTGNTAARNLTDDVEWSAEDGSRTDPDFLCRCVEAAIKAGATTINVPDTVGYATPEDMEKIFSMLRERVPGADQVIFSAHNHNDLGLGVANTLASLRGGARQVECTINGIGERAGNAALEEIVMALRTRHDQYPYTTNIQTTDLLKVSRMLATITSFDVQPNKAIVGRNAFAHESGIHQDGVLKNAATYEIMTPESVGWSRSSLVMGKHSGRAAFRDKLKALGYADMDDTRLNEAFSRFKDLADRKKVVYDDDIVALVDDEARDHDHIRFAALSLTSTSGKPSEADLTIQVDGKDVQTNASGNGPVDAAFNALRLAFPHEARLALFSVGAVTEGTDAQARTTVRLEEDGKLVDGQGADADTVVSAVRAYVHALNKLLVKRARTAPEALTA
jgi:2-isopropylmalate synthase